MKRKMTRQSVHWILSAMVFMGLIAAVHAERYFQAGMGVILIAAAGFLLPDMRAYEKQTSRKKDIGALLICVLAGIQLYSRWIASDGLESLASRVPLSKESLLSIATCLGSLGAFCAVRKALYALSILSEKMKRRLARTTSLHDAGYRMSWKSYGFLLITAAAVITICSKSSPLYVFNNWVDPNCFFTAGKSMLHGKVLYRDIVEQKGFYLYVLHALGYLISNTTFFGVYLLEIAAAFAFLVYAYRIALLFCANEDVIFLIPVLAAFVYGAQSFYNGDSAEEFCLPLLAYALWVGMKALRHNEMPSPKEFVVIGVTSGCVLWVKYTILGFYLGWFVVPAYLMIRKRAWKELALSVAFIALGVLIATLPVLVYFAANGALYDLWEIYFYNNIFIYSYFGEMESSILENILGCCENTLLQDTGMMLWVLLGLLWFGMVQKGVILAELLCCIVIMAAFAFCAGGPLYYSLVFAAFAPTALPLMSWALELSPTRIRKNVRWGLPVAGILLALLLNNNAHELRYTEEDLPQFVFKKYIDQVENPTLLNYGFLDGGFYTVYNIVPHCKYFCKLNIELREMKETQNMYFYDGLSDFVVTFNSELECEWYTCLDEFFLEEHGLYRLYALKSLNIVPESENIALN